MEETTAPKIVGTLGMVLGLPYVARQFLTSLIELQEHTAHLLTPRGERLDFAVAPAPSATFSRNLLAQQFRGEHLLMLDVDAAFDADLYERMVATMYAPPPSVRWDGERWLTMHLQAPLDVVTGVYFQRVRHWPVLYDFVLGEGKPHQLTRMPLTELFPVGACGAGCLLVRRVVFERIKEELGWQPFDNRYVNGERMPEDFSFCMNCRDLDPPVAVYCNPQIVTRHLETVELGYEHYNTAAPPAAGVLDIHIPTLAEPAQ